MIKLKNPYNESKNYNCFGCSAENKNGLNMEFYEDGDEIVSIWNPKKHFEGWHNILHGGIQSTMMDEIACWVIMVKAGTMGVTSNINIKLSSAVNMDKGAITLRASLIDIKRNIAETNVKLFNAENKLCAEATIHYFTFPLEKAKELFDYPGKESFYK